MKIISTLSLIILSLLILPAEGFSNSFSAFFTAGSQSAPIDSKQFDEILADVNSNPKLAIARCEALKAEYATQLSKEQLIQLAGLQSMAHSRLGNFKTGLRIGTEVLDPAKENTIKGENIAYLHNAIGKNYEGLGEIQEAMHYFQLAYDEYSVLNHHQGMATSKLHVAGLFITAELYEKAVDQYEQTLAILDPEKDIFLYTRTLNNLAFSNIEKGSPEIALKHLAPARELALKMNNQLTIAYIYSNSGEAFYYTKQYDEAEKYTRLSLEIAQKNGLETLETATYHYLGLIELAKGNLKKSTDYTEKALKIALRNDDSTNLTVIYKLLSQQARLRNDYKKALEYWDIHESYRNKASSQNIVNALTILQAEFQLKERQQEILLLQQNNEIQKLSLKEEETIRYLGYGIVIILCIGLIVMFYIVGIKSKANLVAVRREKDLLESKRQAEAANKAKSEFLSYMSHELRTPLNAVIGFSEILRMNVYGPLNDKQAEYINYIHEGGALLLKLINDLLHLSKIEAGAVDLDLEKYDLSSIVQDVIPMVQHLFEKNGAHLHEEDVMKNLKPVMIDKIRMDQILVNLISNAVKYGRKDGNVWLALNETSPGKLRLCVKDDGIGIPEDQFNNVFTPFNRAGKEQSGIEGTGAGLSIVKALVEAMGGIIGFDSKLGEGSTFWIELPVAMD